MKINNPTQLLAALKSKGVDIKEFDYVEGRTTEEYMSNHHTIVHGRRFYENPYLWTMVLDMKMDDIAEYLSNVSSIEGDLTIVKAALTTLNENSSIPMKMAKRYIDYANSLSEDDLKDKGIDLEYDIDSILENLASIHRIEWFKQVVRLAVNHHIEPRYLSFGNAGNGMALYYACTEMYLNNPSGEDFANYLLSIGAEPILNESIAFCMACKHAAYNLAVKMLDKGADLHAKGDLGLKMVARNDNKGIKLSESNEASRKILLERYAAEEKKEEQTEA